MVVDVKVTNLTGHKLPTGYPEGRRMWIHLMAYAIGRRVEYYDMPTVRSITREAAENDYHASSFVMGVVESPAFRTTRAGVVADDAVEGDRP